MITVKAQVVVLLLIETVTGCVSATLEDVHGNRFKRVIGGTAAGKGQWPWLVSLQGKIPDRKFGFITLSYRKIYCGASLINDRWLLTAAHCFDDSTGRSMVPRYWHARLGDIELKHDVLDSIKGFFGKIFDIDSLKDYYLHAEKIIIHPQYNRENLFANDIALVKLKESVPVSAAQFPEIQAVNLPSSSDASFPSDNAQCVMKGWGCNVEGGPVTSVVYAVTLPKVNDNQCARMWRADMTIHLCAGGTSTGTGICSGDSGGPLVCKKEDSWVQVGIASFTSRNDPGNFPGVFARVSHYLPWIRTTVQQN